VLGPLWIHSPQVCGAMGLLKGQRAPHVVFATPAAVRVNPNIHRGGGNVHGAGEDEGEQVGC